MNKSVDCIATAKRRWSMLCTNSAIYVLSLEVLTMDLDSLTLISYSCSVVTTNYYPISLRMCYIGNYAIDRGWVHSGIYVHPR